jgi:membrane dipeptidase
MTDVSAHAQDLHRRAVVIDALDVSVMDRVHLERMLRGGVTAANYTITLGDGLEFEETVRAIRAMDAVLEANADVARGVRSVADIEAAKREGRVGIVYGFQNATPFGRDERLVAVFRALGVRIVQLAYMTGNLLADGCLEPRDAGLTLFGRAVIEELDRLGMLIDLSHVGERSTREAIDHSTNPVAFTHANCRAIANTPRNKRDEALRALAERGGVVGYTSLPGFVSNDPRKATLERYLDHIDHAVDLIGVAQVGIGLDFVEGHREGSLQPTSPRWGGANVPDGTAGLAAMLPEVPADRIAELVYRPYATGIAASDEIPNITDGLLRRGYADEDVLAILGGNWQRLFATVWGG